LSQQNGKRVHLEDLAQFSFGQDFSPSARSMGFHTNDVLTERLLKSMAEVVLDLNMQSTHALRESKGGNSQQINSNGYRAWRKDITYEYHLHYWKKGQRIVFSNIRPHNDFGISPLLGSLPNG